MLQLSPMMHHSQGEDQNVSDCLLQSLD
jgi:hypothetical protein